MTKGVLTRFSYGPQVTIGTLIIPGLGHLFTAEDAWNDNQRRVSCIPDGEYDVVPSRFNRGNYDAWEIINVPGRSLIKIHRGNSDEHVQGCIVVGEWLDCIPGLGLSVASSARAFSRLYSLLGGQRWRLSIRPADGLPGAAWQGDSA